MIRHHQDWQSGFARIERVDPAFYTNGGNL